jgi:predicted AAA+ superfamily ATPase
MNTKSYIPRLVEGYAFDENLTGRHMVFLAGPRQVGKSVLARNWLKTKGCPSLYFNWDDIAVRQAFRTDSRFFESPARSLGIGDPWIVFDEIHKRNHWRDILKGAYDLFGSEFRFLITGSARLDLFRRSGDSLLGRYNLFHMFPLNLIEITSAKSPSCFLAQPDSHRPAAAFEERINHPVSPDMAEAYALLSHHGPFPEPFLQQQDRFSRKWHQDYISLIVRQDLKDLTRVEELDKVEHLLTLLPSRIMSPLSMSNLAGELEAAHTTVKNWLEQLKRLYVVFSIAPWTQKISRGLKKENKWYFLDWYYAPPGPARLENMTATYLYRTCQTLTDMGYGSYELYYVRTLDKREIDFVVTLDQQPILTVEVKTGDTALSNALKNRQKWFISPTLGIQVVDKRDFLQKYPENTWVVSIERFLSLLS